MIVVKIELHSAITGKVSELGRAIIANDGTGDHERGNYDIKVLRKGSSHAVTRYGRVEDYPRLAYNIWRLVIRALRDAFPEEK